ncbi:MAG: DUF5811 family protein [Natronomonas sp.]
MYGNTPYGGSPEIDITPEQRKALKRDLTELATYTRELLPDGFVVGGEISVGSDGPRAQVAVQPPVGSIVSAGFAESDDADTSTMARELAAGAVVEAKRATEDDSRPAS